MHRKPAVRFSVIVFAPLYLLLLLPAGLLLPSGVLLLLLSLLDPTLYVADAARYGVWAVGPVAAAFGLHGLGLWLHARHSRDRAPLASWMPVWAVFAAVLYLALWYGTVLVTSIGASDYTVGTILAWSAGVAALATLLLQPAVGLWLYLAARLLRRLPSAPGPAP